MKEKFTSDEYYEWRYCEINTASELISYINKIKGCIIGKAINNIFIQPESPPNRTHIAGYNILNNNSVECLDLVGPSIIKIDEHLIVFDMFGISNLKISFDGLFKVVNAKILELARNEAIDFVKNYNIEDFPMLKNVTALEMFTGLDI